MNKKRKSLAVVSELPETSEETIDAILDEVGAGEGAKEKKPQKEPKPQSEESKPTPAPAEKKKLELLAPLGQHINANLKSDMNVYVAKQKIKQRGYSIKKFLEEAIADKLAKEALKK